MDSRHTKYDLWSLLVSWGCHNKIPQIGCLKQQKFVFSSSGGWKSKVRVPAWVGSGEHSLPGLQMARFLLSAYIHGLSSVCACSRREKERARERESAHANSLLSLLRILIPSWGPLPQDLSRITSQRPHHQIPSITLRVRASTNELCGGHKHSTPNNWIEQKELWKIPRCLETKITHFHVSNKKSRRKLENTLNEKKVKTQHTKFMECCKSNT